MIPTSIRISTLQRLVDRGCGCGCCCGCPAHTSDNGHDGCDEKCEHKKAVGELTALLSEIEVARRVIAGLHELVAVQPHMQFEVHEGPAIVDRLLEALDAYDEAWRKP